MVKLVRLGAVSLSMVGMLGTAWVEPESGSGAAAPDAYRLTCTCKCGKQYVAVDSGQESCRALEQRECINEFQGLSWFRDCKKRYVDIGADPPPAPKD